METQPFFDADEIAQDIALRNSDLPRSCSVSSIASTSLETIGVRRLAGLPRTVTWQTQDSSLSEDDPTPCEIASAAQSAAPTTPAAAALVPELPTPAPAGPMPDLPTPTATAPVSELPTPTATAPLPELATPAPTDVPEPPTPTTSALQAPGLEGLKEEASTRGFSVLDYKVPA